MKQPTLLEQAQYIGFCNIKRELETLPEWVRNAPAIAAAFVHLDIAIKNYRAEAQKEDGKQ